MARRGCTARDLRHLDGRLHARDDAHSFEGVLQRDGVHDRGEHPDVVGAASVHVGRLPAPPDVAAADDDRDLERPGNHVLELIGDELGRVAEMPNPWSLGTKASPESFRSTRR